MGGRAKLADRPPPQEMGMGRRFDTLPKGARTLQAGRIPVNHRPCQSAAAAGGALGGISATDPKSSLRRRGPLGINSTDFASVPYRATTSELANRPSWVDSA